MENLTSYQKRELIYLFLSLIGFSGGLFFIIQIGVEHQGFDLIRFLQEISLNASSRLLVFDLGITGLTFFVFMFLESLNYKIKYWWLAVIGTFLVGLCFSFPLFLYLRERALNNNKLVKNHN
jgi:hypothetical protein